MLREVSKEQVSSFMAQLQNAKEANCLTELPMHYSPKAFIKNNEKNPIIMGFEWERVLKSYYSKENEKVVKKILNGPLQYYINARHECDDLELVSIPATLKQHKQWMNTYLFKPSLGLESIIDKKYTADMGIHIHIDKSHFTTESLGRFIAFIGNPNNKDFINKIARRNITESDWCKPEYVQFKLEDGKVTGHDISINDNLTIDNPHFYGKDAAVNTSPEFPTVELRIFRTVNTKEGLYRNLEFADALVRFCAVHRVDELTAKDFMQYVMYRRLNYPILSRSVQLKKVLNKKEKKS